MIDIGKLHAVRYKENYILDKMLACILHMYIQYTSHTLLYCSKNLDKNGHNQEKLNTEKEKKRIARKKERRATLILG